MAISGYKKEKVKQFIDIEDFWVEQSVTIDRSDLETWIVLEHNNSEISLSINNFESLLAMYKNLLEK